MKLNLRVKSYKGETPADSLSISLDQQSATIGRLKDNTLILPDAMRYLSGHHAKVEYQAPDYYIVDSSTNGVYINHSPTPLGNGNRAKLHNQDLITMGDYDISIEISGENQQLPVNDFDDPFASTSRPLEHDALEFPDDPFSDITSDPIKQMIESNELMPEDWKNDQGKTPDPFDIPSADSAQDEAEQRMEFDHVPAFQEAFQPFKKKNEPTEDIRETDARAIDVEETSALNQADIFADDWFTKDKYHEQNKADPFADDSQTKATDEITDQPRAAVKPAQPDPASPPASVSSDNSVQPPATSPAQDDLIESFLRGANLNDERLARSITADTFHAIGSILRASVQGAMGVLASRAKIKSEMHLDVTMIQPIQNNPIKFSASADEAMTKLLLRQDKGYLPAEQAVDEAFNDIRVHQFSVIAGMQTALIAILKRFDPKKLEHRLQKQSPISANIPIRKQAKLWELFEQLYEEIEHEAEDDFYHLFGEAFAQSYEQQIKKIKASKDEIPIE